MVGSIVRMVEDLVVFVVIAMVGLLVLVMENQVTLVGLQGIRHRNRFRDSCETGFLEGNVGVAEYGMDGEELTGVVQWQAYELVLVL